jgi:hypothetical protein
MKGDRTMRVERANRIEIQRDTQVETLETATHDCGTLLEVPWAVLAAMCASCIAIEDRERA